MRAVVQRVTRGCVSVEGQVIGEIGNGLVVLLGISNEDEDKDIEYLCDKIVHLRIFEDVNGLMNESLIVKNAELLIVSQFTLYGDCRKGKRPSFIKAARPDKAEVLYNKFLSRIKQYGVKVEAGKFQAMMLVEINNDGPVTILLDSQKEF